MIRRSPQEIADFFGCYIAKRNNLSLWTLYSEKPELNGDGWKGSPLMIRGDLHPSLVNVPPDHDWTHLYEPQKKDPIEVFKDIQSRRESAQHQSEVHVEKEYMIVTAHKEIDADTFAEGVMIWIRAGWKPCGGISFDKKGCPYQAMVRGV